MEPLIIARVMGLFALLSWLFGTEGSKRWDGPEWERRQRWLERS